MAESVGRSHKRHKMYPRGIDPVGGRCKMKKYALVALFAVVSLGMVFAAEAVPPTERSGNISITGEVKEAFSLLVPPDYKGTIENGNVAETWQIGNVAVTSNVNNWTIKLTSKTGGVLLHSSEKDEIAYTVTLEGLVKDQSLKNEWQSKPQGRTSKGGNSYPFSITFGPSTNYYEAGFYNDVITVTISHS